MAGTYQQIWELLKRDGKVKVTIPQDTLQSMDYPTIRGKLKRIRKHVSDCKSKDLQFRRAHTGVAITSSKSEKEGWITLELKYKDLGVEVS